MIDKIKLSKKDFVELQRLYKIAQNTPVITFAVGTPSLADNAWERARDFQQQLGEKYGYDWKTHRIEPNRKVIKILGDES